MPAGATVLYVRADAPSEGADGTEAHPFTSLDAALRDVSQETWVLLAAGAYRGSWAPRVATHLVGVCAARVTITGAGAATAATMATESTLDLRGLTIAGPSSGVRVGAGGHASLEGVVLASTGEWGLRVEGVGATVTARDVVVRNADGGAMYGGVVAASHGELDAERFVVRGTHGRGLMTLSSGSVRLADAVIADTLGNSAGVGGVGVIARGAGTITAERTLIDHNTEGGAYAVGGALTLTDCIVRRARGFSSGSQGLGLAATARGTIEATRVLVEDNRQTGVVADGVGCSATLTDCVVRRTATVRDGSNGSGLASRNHAVVEATRTLLERNHDISAISHLDHASLTLTESVVRDTLARGDGSSGVGVVAHTLATVRLVRTLVTGSRIVGVIAYGAGALVDARATMIRDTVRPEADAPGASLVAHTGGRVVADHVASSNSVDAAFECFAPGSTMTLHDVVAAPFDAVERPRGLGVLASFGGAIDGARIGIDDVDGAGIASLSGMTDEERRTSVDLADVFVRSVTPRSVMPGGAQISFALSVDDAALRLERAVVVGGVYGYVLQQGRFSLRTALVLDATRAVGIINASPEVETSDVTESSPGGGVLHDVAIDHVRLPPPPPPSL